MLRDVPEGGLRCRAFEGHGYAACVRLVELGLAVEVGKHAAFQWLLLQNGKLRAREAR
jgi:hypothetical protein